MKILNDSFRKIFVSAIEDRDVTLYDLAEALGTHDEEWVKRWLSGERKMPKPPGSTKFYSDNSENDVPAILDDAFRKSLPQNRSTSLSEKLERHAIEEKKAHRVWAVEDIARVLEFNLEYPPVAQFGECFFLVGRGRDDLRPKAYWCTRNINDLQKLLEAARAQLPKIFGANQTFSSMYFQIERGKDTGVAANARFRSDVRTSLNCLDQMAAVGAKVDPPPVAETMAKLYSRRGMDDYEQIIILGLAKIARSLKISCSLPEGGGSSEELTDGEKTALEQYNHAVEKWGDRELKILHSNLEDSHVVVTKFDAWKKALQRAQGKIKSKGV